MKVTKSQIQKIKRETNSHLRVFRCTVVDIWRQMFLAVAQHIQTGCKHSAGQTLLPNSWSLLTKGTFEISDVEHNQTSTCAPPPTGLASSGGRVTLLVSAAGPVLPRKPVPRRDCRPRRVFSRRGCRGPGGRRCYRLRSQMSLSQPGWHVIGQTGVITHHRLKAGARVLLIVKKICQNLHHHSVA